MDQSIRTWLNRLQIYEKKNVEFIWSEKQQKAFDRLNVIMAKKPVVKIFDPKKDIMLTTDASEHSISGILSNIIQ